MPPIRHWIVTNREVSRKRFGSGYREVVREDHERAPLPVFRIARYTPTSMKKLADKQSDALHESIEFIKDEYVQDHEYSALSPDDDPEQLPGSLQLFLSLYQTMRAAPDAKGDVLFVIHGFNYDWREAIINLQKVHEIYAKPDASPIREIVYFSWPSWGKLLRYNSDYEIAAPSGDVLARFFGKSIEFFRRFIGGEHPEGKDNTPNIYCGRKIHLAAHSMGNLVLEHFVRRIHEMRSLRRSIIDQALLLHADADWHALEPERPLHQLQEYARRIHVYTHASDDALLISDATKNDMKRLGRHGPRDLTRTPPRAIVADCSKLTGKVDLPPSGPPADDDAFQSACDLAPEDPETIAASDPFLRAASSVMGRDTVNMRERMFDHWGYLHRPEEIADIWRVLRGQSSSGIPGRNARDHNRYVLRPARDRT